MEWIEMSKEKPPRLETVLGYCPDAWIDFDVFLFKYDSDTEEYLQVVEEKVVDSAWKTHDLNWKVVATTEYWNITHWAKLPSKPIINK